MRFNELQETTLGGFKVKPLNIENTGVSEELEHNFDKHIVAVTVSDPHSSAVTQRQELKQRKAKVRALDRESAINTAVNWYRKQGYKVHDHHYVGTDNGIAEAIKLNAPQRTIPRDELQGYADRIKTGTKTKRDKFSPIIHGSNIKAITKDDENTEWDLDDLSKQITTRPKAILGTNAKMEKSKTEGEIIYDLTLPALSGIVVDEDTGDFVEITTCPGAGACQLFCYARKGGYVMFPASSMSAAQALIKRSKLSKPKQTKLVCNWLYAGTMLATSSPKSIWI